MPTEHENIDRNDPHVGREVIIPEGGAMSPSARTWQIEFRKGDRYRLMSKDGSYCWRSTKDVERLTGMACAPMATAPVTTIRIAASTPKATARSVTGGSTDAELTARALAALACSAQGLRFGTLTETERKAILTRVVAGEREVITPGLMREIQDRQRSEEASNYQNGVTALVHREIKGGRRA